MKRFMRECCPREDDVVSVSTNVRATFFLLELPLHRGSHGSPWTGADSRLRSLTSSLLHCAKKSLWCLHPAACPGCVSFARARRSARHFCFDLSSFSAAATACAVSTSLPPPSTQGGAGRGYSSQGCTLGDRSL